MQKVPLDQCRIRLLRGWIIVGVHREISSTLHEIIRGCDSRSDWGVYRSTGIRSDESVSEVSAESNRIRCWWNRRSIRMALLDGLSNFLLERPPLKNIYNTNAYCYLAAITASSAEK